MKLVQRPHHLALQHPVARQAERGQHGEHSYGDSELAARVDAHRGQHLRLRLGLEVHGLSEDFHGVEQAARTHRLFQIEHRPNAIQLLGSVRQQEAWRYAGVLQAGADRLQARRLDRRLGSERVEHEILQIERDGLDSIDALDARLYVLQPAQRAPGHSAEQGGGDDEDGREQDDDQAPRVLERPSPRQPGRFLSDLSAG
jgi:hypothetical protein